MVIDGNCIVIYGKEMNCPASVLNVFSHGKNKHKRSLKVFSSFCKSIILSNIQLTLISFNGVKVLHHVLEAATSQQYLMSASWDGMFATLISNSVNCLSYTGTVWSISGDYFLSTCRAKRKEDPGARNADKLKKCERSLSPTFESSYLDVLRCNN